MVDRIVTIDNESNMVRLIHYTAQEYFDRNPIVAPSGAQEKITKTCISYLLLSDITQGPCSNNTAMLKRLEIKPFFSYAASNWGIHARGEPELACKEIILLLTNNAKARLSVVQAVDLKMEDIKKGHDCSRFLREIESREIVSGLSFAAFYGLNDIIKYFLSRDEGIDARNDQDVVNALSIAAGRGHTNTVEALLAAGADIDGEFELEGCTALAVAAACGHEDTVKALVSKGASLQAGKSCERDPLGAAVLFDHIKIINLLLEKGARLGVAQDTLKAALQSQNVKLVEMVLHEMSDDQLQLVIKKSLLNYLDRSYDWSREIVNLLLHRGADVNLCNHMGESQLHIAVRNGLHDVVESLLDYGMDPDIKDSIGSTPLHLATFREKLIIVELLLERGANINGPNEAGETALHLAARRGLSEAVILLVEKGADIYVNDSGGWSPLQHAVANDHDNVFDILKDYAAKPQLPSHQSLLAKRTAPRSDRKGR